MKLEKMKMNLLQQEDRFSSWLQVNKWNKRKEDHLKNILEELSYKPLISIVMPVYNVDVSVFKLTLQSIFDQVYTNWELCICDDCSTNTDLIEFLKELQFSTKVKISRNKENKGISESTNIACSLASGDFLAFVDNDDLLTPDAFGENIIEINKHSDADIIYSDDDKVSSKEEQYEPQFKPDWNPELLLSYMYIGHLLVIRTSFFRQSIGFRKEFDGSQDYDLILRLTEKTKNIYHIHKILYHWKAIEGSTAKTARAKPESFLAGQNAIIEALIRRNISAKVYRPKWAIEWNCGYFCLEFPTRGPEVTIVIPVFNQQEMLERCIRSIITKTTYSSYKILIIDNESNEQKTLDYLKALPCQVVRIESEGKFNFSDLNNKAIEYVTTPYVLFLNNDTEILSPNWLNQMVGYIQFSDVGAVGARLIFPNGLIQHAGLVHGYNNGGVAPAFKMMKSNQATYLAFERLSRECSAVTAACMLTKTDLFKKVGGFDKENFSIGYNDPDYCHRIEELGYRIVYSADSILLHHENLTRRAIPYQRDDVTNEFRYKIKYKNYTEKHYNKNLSLDDSTFSFSSSLVQTTKLQKPVSCLVFSYNLNWEGSSFSNFELVTGLKKKGIINPHIYCFQDGPLRFEYMKQGIPVTIKSSPLSRGFYIKEYLYGLKELVTFIKSINPDLIYANTLQMFYGIDAANELGIPSIWNVRESEPIFNYYNHFGEDIQQRALNCFYYPYQVIFVAHSTRYGCRQLQARNNFTVINNGINTARFTETSKRLETRKKYNIKDDQIVFLCAGTVCNRKNQIELLLASNEIPKIYSDKYKILIIGDRKSEYSSTMHALIQSFPDYVRNSIIVLPETDKIQEFYEASDCFVLTSKLESFPRVILEAIHFGLPIITTPTMGVQEQVFNNVNGKYYKSGNFNGLMEEMVNMINLPDLRKYFSKNSLLIKKGLIGHDEMLEKYSSIFQQAWLSGESR